MTDSIIEPTAVGKKPASRGVWWVSGIIVALCIAFPFVVTFPSSGPGEKGNCIRNLAFAKGIIPALKLYAANHAGQYPHVLQELEPEYLASIESTKYRDPNSQRNYDWFYVAGLRETSPSNWILLASPSDQLSKDHEHRTRIVVFNDGHTEIMSATDFNRQLAEQAKAMEAQPPEKP